KDWSFDGLTTWHDLGEHFDKLRIQIALLSTLPEHSETFRQLKRLSIRPIRDQRIEPIRHRGDPREHGNLFTAQPIGISPAIGLLVMPADNRQHIREGSHRLEDVVTDDGMTLDDGELFVG